ncbi:efflux RND transporter periplasmic adaptor subunit [Halonatronum saccharophilum]|uniref:efflux RND transporter periplasmic adaptor subunit n=1 Tax=Halonatronum saccharophilum TaxID=150060 RepID=UPI000483F552|nr:efflux RND transporter periplasmic adaptor subunit [Halonatronum saccharophilum]
MSKKRILFLVIIIALVIIFSNYIWRGESGEGYFEVKSKEVNNSLRATGIVKPAKTININSTLAEKVKQVKVEAGQEVKKGDPLLYYRSSIAEEELNKAAATLRELEGDLLLAEIRVKEAKLGVELVKRRQEISKRVEDASLKEEINRVDIEINKAKDDLKRVKKLYEDGVIEEIRLKEEEHRLKLLESNKRLLSTQLEELYRRRDDRLKEGEINLEIAQKDHSRVKESYRNLSNRIDIYKSDYQRAKANLKEHKVYSPINGMVLNKEVESGEYIKPGVQMLKIGSKELLIRIRPDEKELGLLEVGQEGVATPRAYPDQRFKVKVVRISPEVDPNRGTIDIYLKPLEGEENLIVNMSVFLELTNESSKEEIIIPEEYIVQDGQPYIYLYQEGEKVKKEVEIGFINNGMARVISGLKDRDKVILP